MILEPIAHDGAWLDADVEQALAVPQPAAQARAGCGPCIQWTWA